MVKIQLLLLEINYYYNGFSNHASKLLGLNIDELTDWVQQTRAKIPGFISFIDSATEQ